MGLEEDQKTDDIVTEARTDSTESTIDTEPLDSLPAEAVEKIEAQVDAYEASLRRQYRRADDSRIIRRKRESFLTSLVERELEDEQRDIEELRREEHVLISTNLVLSLGFIVMFVLGALWQAERIETIATHCSTFFIHNFNWFYILISALSLFFLCYLALSRFGAVVLGDPAEPPEFKTLSWAAMLFSAGMGVGLLFWGAAEPVSHFVAPPVAAPRTAEAARMAMVYAAFHWGLHAWAIYTLTAIGVAYYGFRKRKKYLVSSSIVELTDNPFGKRLLKILADFTATLAVVFGVAAAMGMGVMKICGGLSHAFNIDAANTGGYVGILVIITILFIGSATTGLKRGIQILSNVNMAVAVLLLSFLFLVGPKLFILKVFVETIGQYLFELFRLSFKVAPFTPAYEAWMGKWTLTWLTWWIAWAPFVGIFIARISRGRTIREVIMGALVFPTLFTIIWFSVFGGAGLYLEIHTNQGISSLVTNPATVTESLFALLDNYPCPKITAAVAILLLFTFLITSADSACFVIAMMTTEGDLDPGIGMKVLWGLVLAIITIILVLGGGIKATSAAALTFAFPFSVVMVLIAVSLIVRLSIQVSQKRI